MHLFLNPINYCKYDQSRKEIFFGTFTLGTGRTFEGWLEVLAGLEEDAMEDEAALGSANTLAKVPQKQPWTSPAEAFAHGNVIFHSGLNLHFPICLKQITNAK